MGSVLTDRRHPAVVEGWQDGGKCHLDRGKQGYINRTDCARIATARPSFSPTVSQLMVR